MWHEYHTAASTADVIAILAEKRERARIVAGATDLILELERGVRTGIDALIDVSRIPGLDRISLDEDDHIHLGPLVTHNDCAASDLIVQRAFPLARAAWEVGAPQIRNRATVAGNLITASPANDTITPLMALDASVTLQSTRGQRTIPLKEFYSGVRKTVMEADEMMVDISFPAFTESHCGTFVKLALRRAQAISVVNVAIVLELGPDRIRSAAIALGSVAPTIVRAPAAESYLVGKPLSKAVIAAAARLTVEASSPIDDLRASAAYRREMVRVVTQRALESLRRRDEKRDFPDSPVLLASSVQQPAAAPKSTHRSGEAIQTTINGGAHILNPESEKSLLRLLREDAGLIGTKEGCAEGECGACTVFLDGMAVMSCMVPAPRAHGAEIVTVEGLGTEEALHPVQDAFIQDGAVQCGYCTPGFLMSGAKLLEENPNPSVFEIQQAFTGNLCRCTGYYKIVKAMEDASKLRTQR